MLTDVQTPFLGTPLVTHVNKNRCASIPSERKEDRSIPPDGGAEPKTDERACKDVADCWFNVKEENCDVFASSLVCFILAVSEGCKARVCGVGLKHLIVCRARAPAGRASGPPRPWTSAPAPPMANRLPRVLCSPHRVGANPCSWAAQKICRHLLATMANQDNKSHLHLATDTHKATRQLRASTRTDCWLRVGFLREGERDRDRDTIH